MKILFFFIVCIFSFINSFYAFSQNSSIDEAYKILENRGEVVLAISRKTIDLESFTRMVSIDNVNVDSIYFYASSKEFEKFISLNQNFRIVKTSILSDFSEPSKVENLEKSNFNVYPTYPQYDSIMHNFAQQHPTICRYVNLGTLASGRKIIALHIGDNIYQNDAEPRFLYTSSMHGDELTGFIFMIKLIDFLLSNYGTDSSATKIINNIDLWINPMANPNGTYHGGNSTVFSATRYNSNSVDLNRNYPDPDDGAHPDGNIYQEETNIFIAFTDSMHFNMSANFHGGAEVANYTWDTWSKLPADANWWKYICKEYADTAHFYNNYNNYFTMFGAGITNGYQWYPVAGGRQDFMNYYKQCREVTLEVSNTKLLPENQLNTYWQWSKKSLINYILQVNYGLQGVVIDSTNGSPIAAKVFISNHDIDSSHVFSYLPFGDYYRLLDSGFYSVTYSAPNYYSKTINSIRIDRHSKTVLNVALKAKPTFISLPTKYRFQVSVFPNPADDILKISNKNIDNELLIKIFNSLGIVIIEKKIESKGENIC